MNYDKEIIIYEYLFVTEWSSFALSFFLLQIAEMYALLANFKSFFSGY